MSSVWRWFYDEDELFEKGRQEDKREGNEMRKEGNNFLLWKILHKNELHTCVCAVAHNMLFDKVKLGVFKG